MTYTAEVEAAVRFLDKYCDIPNWRSQVDTSILDLNDSSNCVLGQIYGAYSTGFDRLHNKEGWTSGVRYAFNNSEHEASWIRYLDGRVTVPGPESLVGTVWVRKEDGAERVILAEYKDDSEDRVVYKGVASASRIHVTATLQHLKSNFNPKPKYEIGQVYLSNDSLTVLVYTKADRLDRINDNRTLSGPGFGSVEYMEGEYGPLRKAAFASGIPQTSQPIKVNL